MKTVTFGQYYAVDSDIHRLDARLKMFITIAFIVLCLFFVDTFFMYGILAICVLLVIFAAKLPLFKVLRSLRVIIILMLFSVFLTVLFSSGQPSEVPLAQTSVIAIYRSSLLRMGLLAARLILMMLLPAILTMTSTAIEMTDGIEWFLKPLSLIKIPVWAFALIMNIALRMVPTISEETTKIMNAQKARCARFDSKNIFVRIKALVSILIPLFISSMRRAEELADAMDSRCFKGGNRKKLKKYKFHYRNIIALVVFVALFFFTLVFYYNWFNWQSVTFLRSIVY